MTSADEQPALVLARVADLRKRHELMLLASVMEGPKARGRVAMVGFGWLIAVLGLLALLRS